jgi:hypothetical protein
MTDLTVNTIPGWRGSRIVHCSGMGRRLPRCVKSGHQQSVLQAKCHFLPLASAARRQRNKESMVGECPRAASTARVSSSSSGHRWLGLRPDGDHEQSYPDAYGNFEEPMDGGHPCRLGRCYEHDDG